MRDTGQLAEREYDVLVVGAGIYGACVARDAALRQQRVALIERGDFGGETSHNSLKLIHGGFRYLQHFDLRRIRESVAERRYWLGAAPHLVRPLRFVMPTYGYGMRGPEAMGVAVQAYRLLAWDRNRGLPPSQCLPAGGTVSARQCAALIPGIPREGLRGGAVWYDGQMVDADRVLMECLEDAAEHGAQLCNYVAAQKLSVQGQRVDGVEARDVLTGECFTLRASIVVNACGPWAFELLARSFEGYAEGPRAFSKCMNLVLDRSALDYAFGVVSARSCDAAIGSAKRLFFFTPWRGRLVVGTSHLPYGEAPDQCAFTTEDIAAFVAEVARAHPALELQPEDVLYCYGGLTPAEEGQSGGDARRVHRGMLIDHAGTDGVDGLISAIGEKYTTARSMAERVTDLIQRKQGLAPTPSPTRTRPLPGARGMGDPRRWRAQGPGSLGVPPSAALDELLQSYGTRAAAVLGSASGGELRGDEHADRQELFRRRCLYSIEHEMPQRLTDLLLRRTDLAARGLLTEDMACWAAERMGERLGWSQPQKSNELESILALICARPVAPAGLTAGVGDAARLLVRGAAGAKACAATSITPATGSISDR